MLSDSLHQRFIKQDQDSVGVVIKLKFGMDLNKKFLKIFQT